MGHSVAIEMVATHLSDWRSRSYQWGFSDCAIFGTEFIQKITGKDYAAPFKGKYGSGLEAIRALLANGFKSPGDVIDTELERNEASAFRGNIVEVNCSSALMPLGLAIDSTSAVYFSHDGLQHTNVFNFKRVWCL